MVEIDFGRYERIRHIQKTLSVVWKGHIIVFSNPARPVMLENK